MCEWLYNESEIESYYTLRVTVKVIIQWKWQWKWLYTGKEGKSESKGGLWKWNWQRLYNESESGSDYTMKSKVFLPPTGE